MKQRFICILLICALCLSLFACAPAAQENPPSDTNASAEPTNPESDDTDAQSKDPEQPPEPVELRSSFFATGDNLIHTGIWRQANRNVGGSGDNCQMDSDYDFAPFYECLRPMIEAADVAFLNQETLVAAKEDGVPQNYPAFNTPRACGDAMIELGFDVVNVANNHMLDMQSSGLKNSVEYWRSKEGITQIGAYLDEEDYRTIRVVESNGIKIAFLAYAEDPNNSGQGLLTPLSNYHGYSSLGLYVPAMNEHELVEQVSEAKKLADFVVVAFHWGVENSSVVNDVQARFTKLCSENGVDVVLGSHPHVLQKMEWVEGATDSGKTLVINSLGNMISLMESTEGNLLGGALSLDFVKKGEECRVENVVMTPFVSHCNTSYRHIQLYLLTDYTDDVYLAHYIHRHCQTTLSDFYQIVRDTIPQEFWGGVDYSVR